jgi:hypothetical protein
LWTDIRIEDYGWNYSINIPSQDHQDDKHKMPVSDLWQREQARLGFLSPATYEPLFYEKRLAV